MAQAMRMVVSKEYAAASTEEVLEAAERIAPAAPPGARVQLWLAQMLLPDLVKAVEQVIIENPDKPRVRHVAGGLLTYVYNPLDLIGDDTPYGRLDDAIICALGLQRLRELDDVRLGETASAVCDATVLCLNLLSEDLQDSIQWFIRDLQQSASSVVAAQVEAAR